MPDKKLTDAEIAKALEEELKTALVINHRFEESNDTENPDDHKFIALLSNTIKLINRQKAEIEKLLAEKERLEKANRLFEYVSEAVHHTSVGIVEYKTIEAKNKAIEKKIEKLSNIQIAKEEATKEFAERLKGTFPQDDFLRSTKRISEDIDNILKEMVGENK